MSKRRTKVALALVLFGAWSVVACTAGVGGVPDIGQAYGDKPGAFGAADKPGQDGTDPVPGLKPGAGGSSGSSGKPADGCPTCEGNYSCTVTQSGQSTTIPFKLDSKSGQCFLAGSSSSQGAVALTCQGSSWGATSNGATISCSKSSSPTPTPTPTPPPTPTTLPTAPVPTDAGTRG